MLGNTFLILSRIKPLISVVHGIGASIFIGGALLCQIIVNQVLQTESTKKSSS